MRSVGPVTVNAVVAASCNGSGTTTVTCSPTGLSVVKGDLLVVWEGSTSNNTGALTLVSDTQTNTWNSGTGTSGCMKTTPTTGNSVLGAGYCAVANATGTDTATCGASKVSGSVPVACTFIDVGPPWTSGIDTGIQTDGTGAASTNYAIANSTSSGTHTTETVVACVWASGASTISAGSPNSNAFTIPSGGTVSSANGSPACEYIKVTQGYSTPTSSTYFTGSASLTYSIGVVGFF